MNPQCLWIAIHSDYNHVGLFHFIANNEEDLTSEDVCLSLRFHSRFHKRMKGKKKGKSNQIKL